jgi:hypothetical protein
MDGQQQVGDMRLMRWRAPYWIVRCFRFFYRGLGVLDEKCMKQLRKRCEAAGP